MKFLKSEKKLMKWVIVSNEKTSNILYSRETSMKRNIRQIIETGVFSIYPTYCEDM